MRRSVFATLVIAAMTLAAGCSSSSPTLSNRYGDCTFEPHTVCRNQNLTSLSLEFSDLTGADFSGSDFTHTDLRNAILRNAKLVGTILTKADLNRADLRGADLSGSRMFSTRLDNADWTGSNRTDIHYCQTVLPDGTLSTCKLLDVPVAGPTDPPAIATFEMHRPVQCLNDGIGEGVEVDWKVEHSTNVVFLIDDVRASDAQGTSGVKRLPVPCDRKTHRLTIQAFGAAPPIATQSFTMSIAPAKERPAL
jgi:Uncharacterized low-complexity proteins